MNPVITTVAKKMNDVLLHAEARRVGTTVYVYVELVSLSGVEEGAYIPPQHIRIHGIDNVNILVDSLRQILTTVALDNTPPLKP